MVSPVMRAGAHDYLKKDQIGELPSVVAREIQCARGRQRKRDEADNGQQARDRVTLAMQASRLGIFDFCPQTGRLVCRTRSRISTEFLGIRVFLEDISAGKSILMIACSSRRWSLRRCAPKTTAGFSVSTAPSGIPTARRAP